MVVILDHFIYKVRFQMEEIREKTFYKKGW